MVQVQVMHASATAPLAFRASLIPTVEVVDSDDCWDGSEEGSARRDERANGGFGFEGRNPSQGPAESNTFVRALSEVQYTPPPSTSGTRYSGAG